MPISLSQALRERAVVSFALDQAVHGRAARMVAALAAADLLDLLGELQAMGVRADCLTWVSGCETLARRAARRAGAAGPADRDGHPADHHPAAAAAGLAAAVKVAAVRGPASPPLAAALADLTGPAAGHRGTGTRPAGPALVLSGDGEKATAAAFSRGGSEALTVLVRPPRGRLLTSCQAVGPGSGGRR